MVTGVSMAVARGSWFGLIGANGSGKTTLLRAVAGRLEISGGSCILDGAELAGDRMRRARATGFAPAVETLPGGVTAREVLGMVARGGDALAALGDLRDALGIAALLDRPIGQCSAGMRQRISIACGFAAGHDFVILDEPFNWLDPVAAYDVRAALRARVDAGLTLITALHDLPTLAASCDKGVLLSAGTVALPLDREALQLGRRDIHAFEQQMIDILRGDRVEPPATDASAAGV